MLCICSFMAVFPSLFGVPSCRVTHFSAGYVAGGGSSRAETQTRSRASDATRIETRRFHACHGRDHHSTRAPWPTVYHRLRLAQTLPNAATAQQPLHSRAGLVYGGDR